MNASTIRPCRNAAMPQDRKGLPTEYKAINRPSLNEGHSHGATELKFLLLNEGTFPRNIDDEAVLFLNGQRGFTLIELLVGLALGLIASLAIFSTVSSFETQRRTTGSGADMQQNGLLALYSVEQDIRMAGFGLIDASTTPGTLPCIQVNGANIAPVTITDGGNGADTITTHRLDSDIGGIVTGGGAAMLTSALSDAPTINSIRVDTTKAIKQNDYLLIPGSNYNINKTCSLLQATSLPTIDAASATASVINLGSAAPTFATFQYRIDTDFNLNRTDSNGTNAAASNIVNMQVQYGIAPPYPAAGSQSVACWTDAAVNASGTAPCTGINWAAPTAAQVGQIKAIRVAIVARSAQRTACTTTTNANRPTSWAGGPAINLSGNDWGCYRYKVYQTIIPVRNVIWGNL